MIVSKFLTRFLLIGLILCFSISCDDDGILPGNANSYIEKALGKAANDLLSADKFEYLKVEFLYMPGMQPSSSAKSHLEGLIQNRLNKPKGFEITEKQIPSASSSTYSINQLIEIEENHRTVFNNQDTLAICFLFVDGDYSQSSSVLGVAYRASTMTIFEKTVQDNSGAPLQPSRAKLESTVIAHEFGHILGLVNVGTDMAANHEDSQHSGHCDEEDCLMYYAVETTASLDDLINNPIPSFDAQCIADLQANGGK